MAAAMIVLMMAQPVKVARFGKNMKKRPKPLWTRC